MHRAGRNRNGSRTTFREIWSSYDGSPQAVPCRRRTVKFKSNVRETWRVILVSKADIFHTESLRILAERLSQSEIGLPLRLICYDSPPEMVGVFSTEIKISPTSYRVFPVWRTPGYRADFYFHLYLRLIFANVFSLSAICILRLTSRIKYSSL